MLIAPIPSPPPTYDPRDQSELRRLITDALARLRADVREARVNPRVLDIFVSFDEEGRAIVRARCNVDTLSVRYIVQPDSAPTLAEVQATTPTAGSVFVWESGPYESGTTLHVAVIPYSGPDGDGREGTVERQQAAYGEFVAPEARVVVIAIDATTLTVQASAQTNAGVGTVELESLTGATISTGLAVGAIGTSPQTWVFNRPTNGSGNGEARFAVTFPNAEPDADIIVIPEQGVVSPLFLRMRASLLEDSRTYRRYRLAVADPIPQGTDSVQIAAALTDVADISPAFPLTLTPTTGFSSVVGAYVDVTVVKNEYAGGDGEVVFTATSLVGARVPDKEVIAVPDVPEVPAAIRVYSRKAAETCDVYWSGVYTVRRAVDGGRAVPVATTGNEVVERPAFGSPPIDWTFIAYGTDGTEQSATIIIDPKDPPTPTEPTITSVSLANGVMPGDGGGSVDVSWATVNMPGGETFNVEWEVIAGTPISSGSGEAVGVTSGVTIAMPLGPGAEVRIRVKAYSGATLIASRNLESAVPV